MSPEISHPPQLTSAKPKPAKAVKPRRMWASAPLREAIGTAEAYAVLKKHPLNPHRAPVLVFDLSPASVEAVFASVNAALVAEERRSMREIFGSFSEVSSPGAEKIATDRQRRRAMVVLVALGLVVPPAKRPRPRRPARQAPDAQEEGRQMSPEAQRVAIATACGWEDIFPIPFLSGIPRFDGQIGVDAEPLPNYPSDLNAMHEVEKVLNQVQRVQFYNYLGDVLRTASPVNDVAEFDRIHATAAQRAEAFLRTLNLYDPTQ